MKHYLYIMVLCCLFLSTTLMAGNTPSSKGAMAYIVSPQDGAVVSSPVTVVFGLRGMGVAPAGTDKENTGHHHLLIDGKSIPDADKPMDKKLVKHFGGGQTEAQITLAPGKHSLQLILGDKNHVQHNPPVISKKITITVK